MYSLLQTTMMSGQFAQITEMPVAFSFAVPSAGGGSGPSGGALNYTVSSLSFPLLFNTFDTPAGARLQDTIDVYVYSDNRNATNPGPGSLVSGLGTSQRGVLRHVHLCYR
jgi:hypothetical protein